MSEVSAIIAEHCLFDLDAPIMRLAAQMYHLCHFSCIRNEIMMNQKNLK